MAAALFALCLGMIAVQGEAAAARPTCAGKRVTEVAHRRHIVAKPHAVLLAAGDHRHTITVARGDDSRHTICGGPGHDKIDAGNGNDIIVGGAGNDTLSGHHGDDLIVGDEYNPNGDAVGRAGHDILYGGNGSDVLIGDNLGSANARRAQPDEISGHNGSDTIVADDAVTGAGTARGGAPDWVAAMGGDDVVIGDSFSRRGAAIGSGNDILNHALGSTLMVGDSATLTGTAFGGGNDQLHGMTGGDANAECHHCHNKLYGDSYALASGGRYRGSGNDLLIAGLADNSYLDGEGSNPNGSGRGEDFCVGKSGGKTVAFKCALARQIWKVLRAPAPRPKLSAYGARWPGRSRSPRP